MFNFLAGAPGSNQAAGRPNDKTGGEGPSPTARIAIPTAAEVESAEKRKGAPLLFRPSGIASGGQGRGPQHGTTEPPGTSYGPGASHPQRQQDPPRPAAAAAAAAAGPAAAANRHQMPAQQPQGQQGQQGQPKSFNEAFAFAKESAYYVPPPSVEQLEKTAPPIAPVLTSATVIPPTHANATANFPAGTVPAVAWDGRNLLVSKRQRGNPILNHMRNVRWIFSDDIVPDYQMGQGTCALFLSLKFHMLNKEYIAARMRELQRCYRLRILLVHLDAPDGGPADVLRDLTTLSMAHEFSLVCAWSHVECARYLETFKSYEQKPGASIMEREETDYVSRVASALTAVKGVNRTDALSLVSHMGSLADLLRATPEALAAVPGMGPTKVRRLYDALHEPFRKAPVVMGAGAAQPGPGAAGAAPAAVARGAAAAAAVAARAATPPKAVPPAPKAPPGGAKTVKERSVSQAGGTGGDSQRPGRKGPREVSSSSDDESLGGAEAEDGMAEDEHESDRAAAAAAAGPSDPVTGAKRPLPSSIEEHHTGIHGAVAGPSSALMYQAQGLGLGARSVGLHESGSVVAVERFSRPPTSAAGWGAFSLDDEEEDEEESLE